MTNCIFKMQKRAFTLIEIMIAMTIFSLVAASSFACLRMGMLLVENARHSTRACQLMQSEIERVRALGWNNVKIIDEKTFTLQELINLNLVSEDTGKRYGSSNLEYPYKLKRTFPNSDPDNYRVMLLTVTWKDSGGKDYAREYIAQYTNGGLFDYIK